MEGCTFLVGLLYIFLPHRPNFCYAEQYYEQYFKGLGIAVIATYHNYVPNSTWYIVSESKLHFLTIGGKIAEVSGLGLCYVFHKFVEYRCSIQKLRFRIVR